MNKMLIHNAKAPEPTSVAICYYQPSCSPYFHSINSLLPYTNSIYYKGLTCQEVWYIILVNTRENTRWLILIFLSARLSYGVTDVVVDTNGLQETKLRCHEFVRNAKAQIGISQKGLGLVRHLDKWYYSYDSLVLAVGYDPTTSRLTVGCSYHIELRQHELSWG